MSTASPLLSVIIPTKDRAGYALSTIQGILSWQSDEFELVVQDNGTSAQLEEALRTVNDPRLRYQRCTMPLDMEANFSRATLRASGEYLSFIGDDDGVTEEVIDVARWAKTEGVHAVLPSGWVSFLWPDAVSKSYGKRFSGALRLRPFSGRISYPIAEQEIRKCVRLAGQDFQKLPRPYFGVVRRDSMDQIRQTCGTCFPGPSPDLAGAIALATVVGKIAEIDYPIFIQGTGARSVGGLGIAKRHVGRLEDWPHLPQWSIRSWSLLVPPLFLGQTIWAEDVIQSLTAMKRSDLLEEFNSPLLYALCMCFHPAYAKEIMHVFRRQWADAGTFRVSWLFQFVLGYLGGWWQRLKSLIRNVSALASVGTGTIIPNVGDSQAAMRILSAHLRTTGVTFKDLIRE